MHVPTYLHRNSYDIYYFRIAVPQKFRQYIGKTEIKKSLRTTAYTVALQRSQIMIGQVRELFNRIADMIDDDKLKFHTNWSAGNIKITTNSGGTVEISDVKVDPNNPKDAESLTETIEKLRNSETSAVPVVQSAVEPATKIPLASETIEPYLAHRKTKKKSFRDATAKQYRKEVALLIEILGDRPMDQYDFSSADEFCYVLQRLPKNWKKKAKYRDLSLSKILNMKIPAEDLQADRTYNKKLTVLAGMFGFAAKRGWTHQNLNPFADRQVVEEKAPDSAWKPFSREDIRDIFSYFTFTPQNKRSPNRFFGPLLALYTGARSNEICQLTIGDLITHAGFPCIQFTDEGETQGLKGRNSKRVTPIHSELIRLGFLDYCNKLKPGSMIFPELTLEEGKWDRKLRRWVNENYLVKIGVKEDEKSFRSFRRTFATQLRVNKVEETFAAELLGHSSGKGDFISWQRYASRGELPPLIEALEKLPAEWTAHLKPWKV